MALDVDILEVKAPQMATEDPKILKARCPKARAEGMILDEETGLAKMAHTKLVPIFVLSSVPERGWNAGEVHGMLPIAAKQMLTKELGMELPGAYDNIGKGKAGEKAALAAAKKPAAAAPAAA